MTGRLAPLPEHRYVNHPGWRLRWAQFAHVTQPLWQHLGLVCDVDFGELWYVRADLPDSTCLLISGPTNSPHHLDHRHGWLVTHQEDSSGPTYGVLYNSCPGQPDGPHRHFGAEVEPMLFAIDAYCAEMGIALPRPAPHNPRSLAPRRLSLTGRLPAAELDSRTRAEIFAHAAEVDFQPTSLGATALVPLGDAVYRVVVQDRYRARVDLRWCQEQPEYLAEWASPAQDAVVRLPWTGSDLSVLRRALGLLRCRRVRLLRHAAKPEPPSGPVRKGRLGVGNRTVVRGGGLTTEGTRRSG
ncbi:hypothetical protein [Streptomyces iconiensis]|uniref:DUF2071 domain-containing protein n=1 Tax=Streptomyces iconiensis TaxID=1384038 RepID=A0ABT7A244_9ACTN|nr:hypothetical protein [Streptomyces iconiensis]MDJ1135407.1 hypothetical protein [Streptomyces iconiensis]